MEAYEAALRLIRQYPYEADYVGPRSEALVSSAEAHLGLKFPVTYRRFLLEFGAGAFGSFEVYGVIHEHFERSGVPDAIWYTARLRHRAKLPANLVVVYSVGDGELFCLDANVTETGRGPMLAYQPGLSPSEQAGEVVAEDFEDFFLEGIREEAHWFE